MKIGGLMGLIVLVLDVWAIIKIVQSSASAMNKAIWIVLILALPVLGFIIWFLFGPK
ncbi:PLDc N-terminal domain-containing protein [Desulfomicrobium orale]|uniref:PLDc N-terminal domain-containing protein n=1 Tax=Desulfomicrobium orale TaxID=132132 RepID=UPI0009FAA221|nr:PLDc N-terminal domain-containing protein [Desulfomicrobium orale]MDO4768020.1 PLDc N-terminal domain-containing protein [Pseudomonadota bacterium]